MIGLWRILDVFQCIKYFPYSFLIDCEIASENLLVDSFSIHPIGLQVPYGETGLRWL